MDAAEKRGWGGGERETGKERGTEIPGKPQTRDRDRLTGRGGKTEGRKAEETEDRHREESPDAGRRWSRPRKGRGRPGGHRPRPVGLTGTPPPSHPVPSCSLTVFRGFPKSWSHILPSSSSEALPPVLCLEGEAGGGSCTSFPAS